MAFLHRIFIQNVRTVVHALYVDNVRNALKSLSRTEKEKIAIETKKILIRKGKIGDSVRPVEIEGYLSNFVEGKETNIKYFEGFIEALDVIYVAGARNAFLNGKIKKTNTWRDLLLSLTNDIPSKTLEQYFDNPFVIGELKSLFVSITEGCVTDDKEMTLQRLQVLNDLLKNNRDSSEK